MTKVEAVFYRHFNVYREALPSIDEAVAFLCAGTDSNELAAVGVFVDGEPRLIDTYVTPPGRPPTTAEAERMSADYTLATDYGGTP